MKNFVDLNEIEHYTIVKPGLKSIPVIIEDISVAKVKLKTNPIEVEEIDTVIPKITLSDNLEKEEICAIEGDASKFYGDRGAENCFKLGNLFSELVNEYERATARQNLGIGDSQTLNWGFIKGNIENQSDLKDYIFNSPQFIGYPTAPTPSASDSSNAIATTEWVINYIGQNGGGGGGSTLPSNLKAFSINPNQAMYGDEPVNVLVKWDYNEVISSQKLNGVELNTIVRERTLSLSSATSINLEYVIDGKQYSKALLFTFSYPYYYGKSDNYLNLSKTTSKSFKLTVDDGEFAYLILPIENAILSVNGFIGGFEIIGEQELHGVTYYTYKSANDSLGSLIVNLTTYD